jgi:hypothetical protein
MAVDQVCQSESVYVKSAYGNSFISLVNITMSEGRGCRISGSQESVIPAKADVKFSALHFGRWRNVSIAMG